MKMLQYINILKGYIFLKIHVQFEKLAPGFQVSILLRHSLLCMSKFYYKSLVNCMHCLLCHDVSSFKQMRMYFTNPVKETYPIISTLYTCHK